MVICSESPENNCRSTNDGTDVPGKECSSETGQNRGLQKDESKAATLHCTTQLNMLSIKNLNASDALITSGTFASAQRKADTVVFSQGLLFYASWPQHARIAISKAAMASRTPSGAAVMPVKSLHDAESKPPYLVVFEWHEHLPGQNNCAVMTDENPSKSA